MKIYGGYYCRAMKHKSLMDIQASIHCHSREYQYITESHTNVLVILPLDKFNFVKGKPKIYKRHWNGY